MVRILAIDTKIVFYIYIISLLTSLPGFPETFTSLLFLAIFLGFLVKYPSYAIHLWLPKAHVEAPVTGSIILAALLLKLGGYGLIRLLPLIRPQCFMGGFIQCFSLLGGALAATLCLRQRDIKVLIAYSSVAHMAFAVSATFTANH